PGFQSRFFVLANENRTQDAGHALLRQGRNPKVRKNSGVIKDTPIWTKLFAPLIQSVISLATMPYISPNAFLQKMISSSSPNRVLAQLKAQVENVTSESQVAALINKDWRLILIAADQEEFRQFFSNNTYITVTLTVMAIPIVIILRKQFSIVMEKSY
ncbi:hypothetical protein, partial [Bifidobacterium adolescentis]|uniref:hypothetical protein n=1 Tax=Bifidobacterium adolescentis TaxID=1680 RepID=UPI001CA90F81